MQTRPDSATQSSHGLSYIMVSRYQFEVERVSSKMIPRLIFQTLAYYIIDYRNYVSQFTVETYYFADGRCLFEQLPVKPT